MTDLDEQIKHNHFKMEKSRNKRKALQRKKRRIQRLSRRRNRK